MNALLAVAGGALFAVGVALWLRRELDRDARRMIEEYLRSFPNGCPVCAYYRYGIFHGHITHRNGPKPHRCPERGAPDAG